MKKCPETGRECDLYIDGECQAIFNEQCPEWQETHDHFLLEEK